MTVEDFLKQNKPASGSKLAPFLDDLRRLRSLGYSLRQVQCYLETQEVYVSVQNISAYLQRHQDNQTRQTPDQDNMTNADENPAREDDEDHNLTRRQRGEKEAAKYLTPEAMNPLVKRIMEKQKLKEKKNESSSD